MSDRAVPLHRRYCLITPCRDEVQFARRTFDSVANQTLAPALWIIVDDGSTDGTVAIVEEYAAKLPYIRLIRRADRGHRHVGAGVVEAFNVGYATIDRSDFQYICKLDLDLDLPPGYFEGLVRRMEAEPRLGTTSGKPWFVHPRTGAKAPEVCGDEMSVGMTKFYRLSCFTEIGGFVQQVMWDGIDCHRARMLGWIAESVDEESLRFLHLRPQGASQKGIWTGRVRAGYGQYFMGTAPLYYVASAVFRLFEHPLLIGSVAMLWGYAHSAWRRLPRYDDPEFRRFVRRYQYACLWRGKAAATAALNARQASIWSLGHAAGHPLERSRS
jgi:poly-beta-1,6-N-acetyl-D-glucosamine synthase